VDAGAAGAAAAAGGDGGARASNCTQARVSADEALGYSMAAAVFCSRFRNSADSATSAPMQVEGEGGVEVGVEVGVEGGGAAAAGGGAVTLEELERCTQQYSTACAGLSASTVFKQAGLGLLTVREPRAATSRPSPNARERALLTVCVRGRVRA
jgi:hypothetical protein